jgi:hypothetical protein
MLDKISKLISFSADKSSNVHQGLVAIAEKIRAKPLNQKRYLVIDVKDMESMVLEEKVDPIDGMGRIEVDT